MPISGIVDTSKYSLLSMKIQISVLAIDIFLIGQKMGNIYLSLSFLTIVFLFILQVINTRFLLFFPIFQWLSRETKTIDTYLLYLFLTCSVVFTTCGVLYNQVSLLQQFDCTANYILLPTVLIIGFVTILFFLFEHKKLIRYLLVKKLKKQPPYKMDGKRECNNCNNDEAILTRSITAWNKGKEEVTCKKCGQSKSEEVALRLGDVDIKDKIFNVRLIR